MTDIDIRITLTLEGFESEDGHVRFEDFLKWLDLNRRALAGFDRIVAHGDRATYFRVVSLSHDSPAAVSLEARAKDPTNDLRHAVVERYDAAIREIGAGRVPTGLGVDLLKTLRNLAEPVGKRVRRASIAVGKQATDLTEKFAHTIHAALQEVEFGEGSVEGVVERFNSHDGANTFFVYPSIGPGKVACKFPSEMLQEAAACVTRTVRVYGTLAYLRDSDFPHEISVQTIELYEPEDELPGFDELLGIAPDATGDVLSEDFVSAERDEWEEA